MEFYIKILDLFCKLGDFVFELFAGTKLLIASIVNVAFGLLNLNLGSVFFVKCKCRH